MEDDQNNSQEELILSQELQLEDVAPILLLYVETSYISTHRIFRLDYLHCKLFM